MAKGAAREKGTTDDAKYERLVFGAPPMLMDRLRVAAKQDDRPLSWLIRKALLEYLDRREG